MTGELKHIVVFDFHKWIQQRVSDKIAIWEVETVLNGSYLITFQEK